MKYTQPKEARQNRRNRKRQVIWFNPPYNKAISTDIGKTFLHLIQKHFGSKTNALHKIFNHQSLKISYSCLPSMGSVIKSHNKQINNPQDKTLDPCNCRVKEDCPLSGECQSSNIIYKAKVTPASGDTKHYIGLTENLFKKRFRNHKFSLMHESSSASTELSKFVWNLKAKGQPYTISWDKIKKKIKD